ncbi:MAG: extracellular solute-binding protein, partial [Leptospiraceae bacterium]|nr:extracellular solute-binding protein [Leptospiraceae bacterium]
IDIYKVNNRVFEEAMTLLENQQNILRKYWNDGVYQAEDFQKGAIIASGSWPFQYNFLISNDRKDFEITIPKEGATGWMDFISISKKAKNMNCAYSYMNYLLNKKVQSDISAWLGSVPVNPDACLENDLLKKEACVNHGFKALDNIHFWKSWECETGEDCVSFKTWKKRFSELVDKKKRKKY